jgi:hypothetical protein
MSQMVVSALFLLQSGLAADLPFTNFSNKILLKATAKGQPIFLLLDTGASSSVVDLGSRSNLGRVQAQEVTTGTAWVPVAPNRWADL